MAAPTILSFTPAADETSVVLGRPIEITFDQPVDPATVNQSTFALTAPAQGTVIDADNLALGYGPSKNKVYIAGTFTFPSPEKVVFTPSQALQTKTQYTVTVIGGNSTIVTSCVKNPGGEKLNKTYVWKFTTTDLPFLTGSQTPVVSPLLEDGPQIPTSEIRIVPRKRLGTDFTESIEIHFPDEIDPSSLDAAYSGGNPDVNPFNDILVSIEPVLNDPLVQVPEGLTYSVSVEANKIIIQIQGWEN